MKNVGCIFVLLDEWRHLPNYQLERRVDVFFAAYLHAFLYSYHGVDLTPVMILAFPVRCGTITRGVSMNLSCKIDYLLVSCDDRQAVFAELKTDSASRRDKQDKYLGA